jgi:hypothetical protein
MRTLRKNWSRLVGVVAGGILAVVAVYACVSALGQTAPGLSLTMTGSNSVSVNVTNPVSGAQYQLYYREFLTTNYPWIYVTNGAVNQTSFPFNIGDTVSGYFQAGYNTNFVVPTITVIIQSPANGALIY